MERQILHVDVNNAFLSWSAVEKLKNGEKIDIRNIPAVIGGDEEKRSGIVLAKSQMAKMCGVVTGETIYSAKKKCPNLQVFLGDYGVYSKYSNQLYSLLLEYTDKIERFSVDECFLDLTGYLQNYSLLDKANEINKRVREELGFTVNIGVANNKLLAKMASDFTKPNRVHTLYKSEIIGKMWGLPISELFMLGRKTVPKLQSMGIKLIGDLALTDKDVLVKKLGKHGKLMWEYANGIDNSEVVCRYEKPKSIGHSITLARDVYTLNEVEKTVLALTEQVTYRLRKYNLLAKTVSVQLRTKDFKDFSHQKRLNFVTSSTKEIFETAKEITIEMFKAGMAIRLVGVRVDNLLDKEQLQLSIFDGMSNKKQEKIDCVLDNIKKKYGYAAITRAGKMEIDKNIMKSN